MAAGPMACGQRLSIAGTRCSGGGGGGGRPSVGSTSLQLDKDHGVGDNFATVGAQGESI